MKTATFEMNAVDDDGDITEAYDYSVTQEEFASEEDFDNFVEWATGMIRDIHNTPNAAILKVVVTDTPIVTEYEV